jgi:DNA topoisomerase-3
MLILCEKPSVAKDFAAALGASPKKGCFEGADVVITYCIGHLFELFEPDDYDFKYKKWSLEDLPIIPETFQYVKKESTASQADIVLELLKRHAGGEVLIATDAGREGELIARIALLMAGVTEIERFRRFWVSEALTPEVITGGIRDSKPLSDYNNLSTQAFARQRADWLVGMNLSRFMSIGNPPPSFSVGRVQTAVLSAVYLRNAEIKNFIPQPYKELEAGVFSESDSGIPVGIPAFLENPKTGKPSFFPCDEDYLKAAVNDYCGNKRIDSVDVEAEDKNLKPPKLLNITGLQKEAFRRFGYKPEETLNLAQNLYELHKCLSYPRTPSRVMGDNNVELFREKFELLKESSPLSAFCDPALISSENKHIFNSALLEDHHALIPLAPIPPSASEQEHNVYSVVLEFFFTTCMPDCLYTEKELRFHVGPYVFAAKIRETSQKGWKETKQKEPDSDEDIVEAAGFSTDNCFIQQLDICEKLTRAKKEFAIDTLLAFMEHPRGEGEQKLSGLGTPATRAEIIKTLFFREYLKEDKKKLCVTEHGRFLLEQLSGNEHLKRVADIGQTTDWEERLSKDPGMFEKEITEYVTSCVKSEAGRAVFQQKSLGPCPLCKKPVYETKAVYGCSGYKDIPKCQFVIWKTTAGAAVSSNDASLLLLGQKTKIKKCKNKNGKPFEAAFALKGGKIEFLFK